MKEIGQKYVMEKGIHRVEPWRIVGFSGVNLAVNLYMGLTMYIQQKLNPKPTNKDQARMFALMPLIFMFMLGHFASGLVIYWTLSNVLSIIQQKAIMRKVGV